MYNPDDQGSTPVDSDTRANARAMGIHLAEWGVPVGMAGYQIVDAGGHAGDGTNGRGYDDDDDAAGAWLRKNDPTGHAVKRKGGFAAKPKAKAKAALQIHPRPADAAFP